MKKRTPWWARLTSPGRGMLPPMRPASEMEWWANGRDGERGGPGRGEEAGDRVELVGLERFVEGEGRQDGGEAAGEHGLARTRWSHQQHVRNSL
jgi:hypothetical protein